MQFKVLFESSSIIHGVWPAFTCRKNVGEGFWNRVAYTWYGAIFLSVGVTFLVVYIAQVCAKTCCIHPTVIVLTDLRQ